ncbi:hypothetical protein [Streptomyces sp. NPDC001165]|uniref:hypothetical protein n=1 Tax=Streptomyces sp. NPDC001165 TaxID=3364546 RepID=UPI0036BB0F81
MRNQRALAAACAAVAVLGPAAPVAVADGMGGGGGSNTVITIPGNGNIGNGFGNGLGNNNGNFCQGNNNGRGDNGRGDNGRCDNFDRGNNGRGNNNGRGDENDQEKHHGDGNPRNIVVSPNVLPPEGGRLAITVDNCRGGGTASSDAFSTTVQLSPIGNDTARGVATVPSGRSGTYDITVNCNGRTLSLPDAFTVGSGVKAGHGGGNVGLSGSQTTLGAVQAGFGGSVTSGATPADMAIGGGLVASAVIGGGMSLMRRRPERRF